MISSRRLYAKFIGELDRINTAGNKSVSVYQADLCMQKAVNLLVFEIARHTHHNKDARMYLRKLEVNSAVLELDSSFTEYSTLAKYPIDVSRPIRYRVVADKTDKCTDDIISEPIQRDELQRLRFDAIMKPNYNLRRTFHVEVSNGMEIVTNGEFGITKVYLDYYKRHPKILTPSVAPNKFYIDAEDNKITADQGLLLDDLNLEDIVVQLSVLYSSENMLDIQSFNLKKDEILSSLNLVKSKLM